MLAIYYFKCYTPVITKTALAILGDAVDPGAVTDRWSRFIVAIELHVALMSCPQAPDDGGVFANHQKNGIVLRFPELELVKHIGLVKGELHAVKDVGQFPG
jgi:hypothetical protein